MQSYLLLISSKAFFFALYIHRSLWYYCVLLCANKRFHFKPSFEVGKEPLTRVASALQWKRKTSPAAAAAPSSFSQKSAWVASREAEQRLVADSPPLQFLRRISLRVACLCRLAMMFPAL